MYFYANDLTHLVIWSVRFQMFVLMGTLSCYMLFKSLSDMLHKYTDILHVFIYKAVKKPWSSPHFFVFLGKSDIGGVIYGYVKTHRNPVYKKKRLFWMLALFCSILLVFPTHWQCVGGLFSCWKIKLLSDQNLFRWYWMVHPHLNVLFWVIIPTVLTRSPTPLAEMHPQTMTDP